MVEQQIIDFTSIIQELFQCRDIVIEEIIKKPNVEYNDMIRYMQRYSFPEATVRSVLDVLIMNGNVYEPLPGYLHFLYEGERKL